jgi:hypothetical protein
MASEPELPEDVLAALRAGRKIDAIKLLRAQRSLDLKESKQIIDAYLAAHPTSTPSRPAGSGRGFAPLLLAAAATAAAYLLYRYFS